MRYVENIKKDNFHNLFKNMIVQLKTVIYCMVYNICRNKMYDRCIREQE